MIRFILIISIFLSILNGSDIEGFRSFKWGSTPTKDMVKMSNNNKDKEYFYEIKNDNLNIGTSKLNQIAYKYFDNRLSGVMLVFNGYSNFLYLKETLTQKYGELKQFNKYIDNYHVKQDDTLVIFNYSKINDTGLILISSTKIEDEAKEYVKSSAKQGANDL